jgi:hypothetical protein
MASGQHRQRHPGRLGYDHLGWKLFPQQVGDGFDCSAHWGWHDSS